MNLIGQRAQLHLIKRGLIFIFILLMSADGQMTLLYAQDANVVDTDETAKSVRRKSVIRQTSPATCGPAAIATLLTFYFDDPATEEEVMKLAGTDRKSISNLRQLRNACRARGYQAEGFRLSLQQLLQKVEKTGTPVLVHLKEPTQHYVLVVGSAEDFILISDPSRGEVSIHRLDFLRRWDNFALVVRPTGYVNRELLEQRKRSAEIRIQTLRRANSLMSTMRF